MKKLYLKSVLLLVLTLLVGLTSCKKDEFKNLSLSFSTSKVELDEGGYVSLKKYLVIQPSNLDTITLAWSSSDESVVTVTPRKGGAEAVSDGTATITVSAYGKSASVKVEVLPLAVTDFKVPGAIKDIFVNVPRPIEGIEITPGGVNPARISWSCKDGKESKVVFQYNQEEHLWYFTATEAGTYKVEATIDEFTVSSELTVSVKPITLLKLSEESISLLSQGEERRTVELTYTLEPEDASYQEVEWSATPSGIINLDKGKITTIDGKEGIVTVTLKHKAKATGDKDIEATCKVVVTKTVAVESFTLSETGPLSINIGKAVTIDVKDISPEGGDVSGIKWKADDESALKLSVKQGSKCTITGVGTETKSVTLTATAPNGFQQSVKIKVNKIDSNLSWNIPDQIILFSSNYYELPKATVDKEATIQEITYKLLYGGAVATDMNMQIGSKVELTTPSSIGTSEIKKYELLATCDGITKKVSIILFSNQFIRNNINRSDENIIICGSSGTKAVDVNASRYITADLPLNLRDSILFTPDKSSYGILRGQDKYGYDYSPSGEYSELVYDWRPVGLNGDVKTYMEITVKLYDYKRNKQSQTVRLKVRNSFLGYYYERYDYGSTTPAAKGNIKDHDEITAHYYKVKTDFYWCPNIIIYEKYYTDFTESTVGMHGIGGCSGHYNTDITRDFTVTTDRGDKIFIKYKK